MERVPIIKRFKALHRLYERTQTLTRGRLGATRRPPCARLLPLSLARPVAPCASSFPHLRSTFSRGCPYLHRRAPPSLPSGGGGAGELLLPISPLATPVPMSSSLSLLWRLHAW